MVDQFSSQHHGLAKKLSKVNYSLPKWKQFYDSLVFLFEIERELYETEVRETSKEDVKGIIETMLRVIDDAEARLREPAIDSDE